MTFVRALFPNKAESEDELSFLKDDVLQVLERDYDGMQGWWLCELKGAKGIAPANRLIAISKDDNQNDYDCPKSNYETENNVISLPEKMRPKTEELFSNDYDIPQHLRWTRNQRPHTTEYLSNEDYDVPAEAKLSPTPLEIKIKEYSIYENSAQIINSFPIKSINNNKKIEDKAFASKKNQLTNCDINKLQENKDDSSPKSSLKNKHFTLLNDMDYDTPLSDKRNTSYTNQSNRFTHAKISSTLLAEDYDMPKSSLKALNGYSDKHQENDDKPTLNLNADRVTSKSSIIDQDYDRPQSKFLKHQQNNKNRFTNGFHRMLQNEDYDLPKQSTGANYRKQNVDDDELHADYDRPTSRLVPDERRDSKKADNRDSLLAEYDVPADRPDDRRSKMPAKTNAFLDTDKYIIQSEPMNLAPFNSACKEVTSVLNQLPQFAEKWRELKNEEALPPIVKMVAFNVWNKLQASITHAAKLTAMASASERPDVVAALNKVKESGDGLELVLGFLNNYNKSDATNRGETDYIARLLTASKSIEESLSVLKSLFESIGLKRRQTRDGTTTTSRRLDPNSTKNMHASFEAFDHDAPKTKDESVRAKSYDGILDFEESKTGSTTSRVVDEDEDRSNVIYRTKSLERNLDEQPAKRSESRYSAILMRPFHHLVNKDKRNAMLLDEKDVRVKNKSKKQKDNRADGGLFGLRKKFRSLSRLF